jgi:hypothetical protein
MIKAKPMIWQVRGELYANTYKGNGVYMLPIVILKYRPTHLRAFRTPSEILKHRLKRKKK